MRKQEQREQNETVLSALEAMNADVQKYGLSNAKQLRSCRATVFETPNYYILVSYNTTIACIEKNTNTLYDFLRFTYGYTSTSAQHISKFKHDYGYGKWGCEHEFRYYEI